jgi:hypothetical protein
MYDHSSLYHELAARAGVRLAGYQLHLDSRYPDFRRAS